MPSDTPQKLTKKQRKGLAFRQKKSRAKETRPEPDDVPEVEDLDAQAANIHLGKSEIFASLKTKGKEKEKPSGEAKSKDTERPTTKKRKHTETEGGADPDVAPKKRKRRASGTDENANSDSEESNSKPEKQKTRYILFVGNLKYSTSKEAIQAHFAHCDPPPTIRLLTPKSAKPTTNTKSKGCAFLEFKHRNALQQALKLHHSTLEGRLINVELTAGGGGKSVARIEKVQVRNRALEMQRKAFSKTGGTKPALLAMPERPQRHSSTSGAAEAPMQRRTWTIPEAVDEGGHRGGVKHTKKRGVKKNKEQKTRDWGTGVNAIPVG